MRRVWFTVRHPCCYPDPVDGSDCSLLHQELMTPEEAKERYGLDAMRMENETEDPPQD